MSTLPKEFVVSVSNFSSCLKGLYLSCELPHIYSDRASVERKIVCLLTTHMASTVIHSSAALALTLCKNSFCTHMVGSTVILFCCSDSITLNSIDYPKEFRRLELSLPIEKITTFAYYKNFWQDQKCVCKQTMIGTITFFMPVFSYMWQLLEMDSTLFNVFKRVQRVLRV